MSRYIDADAIKIPSTSVDMFENCRNCKLLDADQVREIIDSAPSIDLVRCKECKCHFYDEFNDCKMCYIHEYGEIWEDDDFCSYGERREP